MKGNILVTVLICVFFVVIFLGFLSYCWYARHVKVGVLFSKAMAPGQRRVGRDLRRQRYRGQRDIEQQAPLQVPRYTSRGWSRARTRSRPREGPRNPDYLIVEEARPGERPRVTRYSPGRVAMSFDYNGEGRNQYRSNRRLQSELEYRNRNDILRPPEGVITKESIHKWASKTHPNGSGWEAVSHGQKGEHHASRHDEKAESHKKESNWGHGNEGDHKEKAGSHKKASSWGNGNNDNQPKGSIHSPKKAASKGSKAVSTKWTQVSKKVSHQQRGNEDHTINRKSKNSDWGNSKKSDHNNENTKKDNQGNDPDTWVSEDHSKVRIGIKELTIAGLIWNLRAKITAHTMTLVQRGMLNLLAKRKLRRQDQGLQ
ncbi:uncharacterized protein N7503_001851 [Penicillium pulvis]|uniref:uncharacterized protein n=1 Tax=Penicillium pulvis TaxID=1562058 RepID=UPI002549112A|nr:uncharacterized protein N7503_001851 [Penicillium pulvis]KAJ5809633.1 hypothetical protein N7503_001851 [Penicillium pulvis]